MLKKGLSILAGVMATSLLTATVYAAPYVGAGIGVLANTDKNTSGSYRGMPINLFAGYGGIVSENFYLGGELSAIVLNSVLADNGLKTTYSYGLSFMPGIMISDHTLGFMRLGMLRTHLSASGDNVNGGQLGLGLQTSLTEELDLRGEYDFSAYKKVSDIQLRQDQFTLALVYKFD